VASGKYPLVRGAYVVVGDRPVGDKKKVIDFLLGPEGQEIVGKSDLIPLKDLEPPK
jgi:ABC-type phosphate transport system substrate-binding protein